jgi:hypothetical protein
MVHSSAFALSTNGERLMCSGFSLSETIYFGGHEFITDCFDGLSLSPRRNDSGATFIGSTRSRSLHPILWPEDAMATQAMMMVPPWVLAPWTETGLPFE